MRGTICGILMVLMITKTLAQQARNDGAYLYEACNVVASAPEDLSNLNGFEMFKAAFCLGYLRALQAALLRLYDDFKATMPKYGQWKDENFVKGWLSSQILLGADVCFPQEVRPKTLAMIISKYGKDNPNQLSSDMFLFAGWALQSAYPAPHCAR
jgi:Rap1a immunity proteins